MNKILTKLAIIQEKLNVVKGLVNDFGGFNYRSCEGILEALKPLLKETKTTIQLSDEVLYIGDRFYIKAIAIFTCIETGESTNVSAFAREVTSKTKMDECQISGSSSSYARKYALSGLFALDDNKDSDYYDNTKPPATTQRNIGKQTKKAEAEAEKPWLNKDTKEFTKCVVALKGTFSMNDLRKKYKISKETAALLETETLK